MRLRASLPAAPTKALVDATADVVTQTVHAVLAVSATIDRSASPIDPVAWALGTGLQPDGTQEEHDQRPTNSMDTNH